MNADERRFGKELFQVDTELAGCKGTTAIDALGFASGMILPAGLLFGIDDPAEGDAPGVVLLAFGKHGSDAVFRRQDLDAEENRLCWIWMLKGRSGDDIRDEVFRACEPDRDFGNCLHTLLFKKVDEQVF